MVPHSYNDSDFSKIRVPTNKHSKDKWSEGFEVTAWSSPC